MYFWQYPTLIQHKNKSKYGHISPKRLQNNQRSTGQMLRLADLNPNKTSNFSTHYYVNGYFHSHWTYNYVFNFLKFCSDSHSAKMSSWIFYGVRHLGLGVRHIAVPCNYEFYNNCSISFSILMGTKSNVSVWHDMIKMS